MAREIADGIHWIQGCHAKSRDRYRGQDWYEPGHDVHSCNNAFLVVGEETLLFDTLAPAKRDVALTGLESALDGRALDYLAPSHPENPHAGNTHAILEAHPEATLLAPDYGNAHELYRLGDSVRMGVGEEVDLGGPVVRFVEPLFVDHFLHTWLYEETRDVLFCVDWFGYPHLDVECGRCFDEIGTPMTVTRLSDHPTTPFFWLKFADPAKLERTIEWARAEYGRSMLAPTHGLPIREDAAEHMSMIETAFTRLCETEEAVIV